MALLSFLKKKKAEEKKFKCVKCGKERSEAEGVFILEGSAFCCKECCGDPSKGEHKAKTDKTCEFC